MLLGGWQGMAGKESPVWLYQAQTTESSQHCKEGKGHLQERGQEQNGWL